MTVGTKIQQTLASAEGVKANLTSFALETNDQQAKQMYSQLAQSMENIVTTLKDRVSYVEQQEPQYKQQ
ncbi:DUF1657 domain-containing protein [Ammoniphilus sp. CFH 90114]|uniref:DUF1657 domain-containing protein n=1 Tax=Ammoniphilus sp. CFH 90114 TaxID=2493665 RepID=UPI00100E0506|nr:DUF1657 domain-containing protein [Ammoniphilus sp. CFH 90114]RXT04782.1 DUF1657 domain-containing protein [Ammoniphilus sp. CFH 90114]